MILNKILSRIAEEQNLQPNDSSAILEKFVSEKVLNQDILQNNLKISNLEMEELYREAYEAYSIQNYTEAHTLFRWLALFNPLISKYWLGFAATSQALEHFEEALKAYSVLTVLDPNDPTPHFHAAQIYLSLKNEEKAKAALHDAYQIAIKDPSHHLLVHEILALQGVTYA